MPLADTGILDKLELELGYRFSDPVLLRKALIHSSHAHEQNISEDNEQLEFLGDSVLGLIVSDLLFRAHPNLTEGELSKLKGFFVSSANLVKYAEQLDLGRYLYLGKGEEKTGGRSKQALLVDAFEASNVMRRQRRGNAKHATSERDEAMAALDDWMRDFRAVARAAFREQPQSLTKLGLSAR